jgi:hypothetical protein
MFLFLPKLEKVQTLLCPTRKRSSKSQNVQKCCQTPFQTLLCLLCWSPPPSRAIPHTCPASPCAPPYSTAASSCWLMPHLSQPVSFWPTMPGQMLTAPQTSPPWEWSVVTYYSLRVEGCPQPDQTGFIEHCGLFFL